MTNINKYIISIIFYASCALGLSITIKTAIGVSAFNSLNLALSEVLNIKVGTITIALNLTFLLVYMMMTKFKYWFKYILQTGFLLFFGTLVNFYVYGLLADLNPSEYIVRVLLLAAGTTLGGLSVGVIIHMNVITFPIESLCVELEERSNKSFAFYRYGVDIVSAIISVSMSISLGLPLFIREGTIISMLLLTTAMNFSKQQLGKRFKKPQLSRTYMA